MEEFVAEHAAGVVVLLSVMTTALVAVSGVLVRVKFGHIDAELRDGKHQLKALDDRVSTLEGGHKVANNDIGHLSEVLERYIHEIKGVVRSYQSQNEREHDDIKKLILRERAAETG